MLKSLVYLFVKIHQTCHLFYHHIILILFLSLCTALSAVPQMCHSGNILGFCLKGTRQVEATLIVWLNNITYKETPLQ